MELTRLSQSKYVFPPYHIKNEENTKRTHCTHHMRSIDHNYNCNSLYITYISSTDPKILDWDAGRSLEKRSVPLEVWNSSEDTGSCCKGLSGKIAKNAPQTCKVSASNVLKSDKDVTGHNCDSAI